MTYFNGPWLPVRYIFLRWAQAPGSSSVLEDVGTLTAHDDIVERWSVVVEVPPNKKPDPHNKTDR